MNLIWHPNNTPKSMELSRCETYSRWTVQEITPYRFVEPQGSLPCSQEPATWSVLTRLNLLYIFTPCFSKIHFCIISQFQSKPPMWFPSCKFSAKMFLAFSSLHVLPIPHVSFSLIVSLPKLLFHEILCCVVANHRFKSSCFRTPTRLISCSLRSVRKSDTPQGIMKEKPNF